jgi:hypothetical protein
VTDDRPTIAAIAILAMCIVTADHEAIGHGGACLAFGGHITLLTSVYFDCAHSAASFAAYGPIGNLLGAGLAWLALKAVPASHARLRLLLLLVMAFGFFWEAGYMLYAALRDTGDYIFAARALLGTAPGLPIRIALFAAGIALYVIAVRAVRGAAFNLGPVLRLSWFAAGIASVAAASFYAPDRLAAMGQAALEIGAASLPLLGRYARRGDSADVAIGRSFGWIAAAVIVYAGFVATLGHGLPWATTS